MYIYIIRLSLVTILEMIEGQATHSKTGRGFLYGLKV